VLAHTNRLPHLHQHHGKVGSGQADTVPNESREEVSGHGGGGRWKGATGSTLWKGAGAWACKGLCLNMFMSWGGACPRRSVCSRPVPFLCRQVSVVVKANREAEQQAGHDNVAQAQHGEAPAARTRDRIQRHVGQAMHTRTHVHVHIKKRVCT
jgi:hypothetical protein